MEFKTNVAREQNFKIIYSGNKMLNISGVLYNSTNTKLVKSSSEKVVVIRGEKFTLDSSGTKLQRDSESGSSLKLSRIDIGGLTYKSKLEGGTYERDNSHNIRSHLR